MSHGNNRRIQFVVLAAGALLLLGAGFAAKEGAGPPPATAQEVVATYDSLADTILGVKRTEENLVTSFLAAGYAHAEGRMMAAQRALKAGDKSAAQSALEDVAALVANLGTEGDSSVARVRKRLLEGGHHHNAEGEAKGIYDEGYVIVTRAAKKRFLDASKAIAALKGNPTEDGLAREWKNVESAWKDVLKERKKR